MASSTLKEIRPPGAPGIQQQEVLPLVFEANVGQTNSAARFLARARGYMLFLTRNGTAVAMGDGGLRDRIRKGSPGLRRFASPVIRMNLLGANARVEPRGLDLMSSRSNYFKGRDPAKWVTNVPQYGRVLYPEVYPGIDLIYYGRGRSLEYDFVVSPGADPARIRVVFTGVDSWDRDGWGNVVLRNGNTRFVQQKPVVYQEREGKREYIAGSLVRGRNRTVRFAVGRYDKSRPLMIDPVLSYSTYLGGSEYDEALAIAANPDGSAVVAGLTSSADFPVTGNASDRTASGIDLFVAELDPSGTGLLYSTFLGGAADENAGGIAIDGQGDVYVTGQTSSVDFPVTPGAFQPEYVCCGGDGFVAKLNSDGSRLLYSTYLGGAGADYGRSIAVDSGGNAYVAGETQSADLPVTATALQPRFGGGVYDSFVAKLNGSGTGLVYLTYLGGSRSDNARSIAVADDGSAFVAGLTTSADLPTTPNSYQRALRGARDGFVARLNPSGSAFAYSSYLGGWGEDEAYSVAIDQQGSAFVAGRTTSADFPVTPSAYRTVRSSSVNGFLAKFDPQGATLAYSTFFEAVPNAVALDAGGNALLTGSTTGGLSATPDALQPSLRTGVYPRDAFLVKFSATGSEILYSSYMGGSSEDRGNSIAVDGGGGVYIAGFTRSVDFPTSAGTVQPWAPGDSGTVDAFVAKVSLATGSVEPVNITLTTTPPGLTVSVDGVPYSTPRTFVWLPGQPHSIGAASVQGTSTTRYAFSSWSDGGALAHTITVPARATAYSANYETQHLLSISVSTGGTAGPSGGWYAAGQLVSISVSPAPGFRFGEWTGTGPGSYSGTDNPATVTMSGPVAEAAALSAIFQPVKIAVLRGGTWLFDSNGNGAWDGTAIDGVRTLGQSGDIPVVGDWNGDGRTKMGIFRGGQWYLDYDGNGVYEGPPKDRTFALGQTGDIPVVGDWNGDGRTKAGIFRKGTWMLDYDGSGSWNGTPADRTGSFGTTGDIPVVGDWDGRGRTKVGVFRAGRWFLDNGNLQWESGIDVTGLFGTAADIPVVGDWNGSGPTKVGVFRAGTWFLDNGNVQWDGSMLDRICSLGQAGDTPVPGDWNGSGTAKIGVFRSGTWLLDYDGDGLADDPPALSHLFFGTTGDKPLIGHW